MAVVPSFAEGDLVRAASARASGRRSWSENVFSHSASLRNEIDDEEALKWAALEKLPTYDRLRTAILRNVGDSKVEEISVSKLSVEERRMLVEKILAPSASENEVFVYKLRDRIDKVGIELPRIEVRFEQLEVSAKVHVGSRGLPTLTNFVLNFLEKCLDSLHLLPSRKQDMKILDNISGIVKPSRMTLLLGPPSSGKTTLLLALAGKLQKSLKVSGRVTYNGHEMTEFVPQRTSAYISQHDLHSGELTVRETFDFASRCQGIGSRYEMISELAKREKQAGIKPDPDIDAFMKASALEGQETSIVTDYVLKILGLDICADTIVGDHMRRGISGGQKKRVTTGEMLVGPAKSLFMDEISTGLDSSTTYQIVRSFRQFVHLLDATMVISLLQPAPETYELFDDLILIAEGIIVYQGPREQVEDFFEAQGFKCPARKGVADFLQEVTSIKDQEQYWMDKRMPYRYVSIKQFADAFQKFHVGQNLVEELSRPFDKGKSHPAALVTKKYALENWEMFKALLGREILLMKRNSFVYIFKTVQIILLAFITMTVFIRPRMHQNTIEDGSRYMAAIFFGILNIMFNGFAELSMTIFRLPVFFKQRDLLFFPAWSFALPAIVTKLPLSILEPSVWVFMTYYVMNMAPAPGRFFRQYLGFILINQMSSALFRFIAALSRVMVIANTFGFFSLLMILALGGFLLSRDDIHPWWIWGYWISPMMYSQNALAENEFRAKRWDKTDPANPTRTIGVSILKSRGLFPERYWYWLGMGALVGYIIVFNVVFTLALTYLNPMGSQAIVSKEHMEQKKGNLTGDISKRKSTRRLSARSSTRGSTVQELDDSKRGMVLPFQPLSITFNDVNYFVDMPAEMKLEGVKEDKLQLLHNISGAFRPGILTALVGVSGAGKTTLMDVLAGRKTGGYIDGDIRISGYPKKHETFARISGYCEQNDIHTPNVTVYESLVYSAWLRLSQDIDKDMKTMFVEEVMELVELNLLRDSLVGLPGVNGLSTEQRKRLTIAVELVANPSIIFMDEPTSGLDARAAAIVMRTVRNTVDTGRTVVCTIHQPSIDIFEAFDELLLMKRGGRVIYAGTLGKNSQKLVEYFESIESIPPIKDGYNPATWMLEVSSAEVESRLNVDFADIYSSSHLYQENQNLIKQLSTPPEGTQDLSFPTKYPLSFLEQCLACLWKQHFSYWRNPSYVVVRIFFTVVISLMFGTMFWDVGSERNRQQGLFNLMGSMYAAVLFIGCTNASAVQPVVAVERTVYYREKAAGMYSSLPYAFGQVVIEIPYVFLQAVLYGVIVYGMMSLEWTAAKFFWFIFFMYFTFLYFTFYGMMAVAVTPNEHIAAIVSSGFYSLWNLFSGFLIPRPAIPVWWRWYYWCSPVAWSLYGILASQFGDVTTNVKLNDGSEKPLKQYLEDYFGFKHDFLGAVAGVHVGLVVLFAVSFAWCIKVFNFQKR